MKESVPVLVPEAVGVNVTEMLQLKPAPSVSPQALAVMAKSPLTVTLARFKVAVPLLVRATTWAIEVVPTV